MLLPCAERKELDAVREPWTYSMSAAAEDPERRRLRQQAELAGSLAPRGMATYAGERGLWRRCTRAERQRIVLVFGGALVVMAPLVLLIFGVTSVYVVAALGVSVFGSLLSMTALAVAERRRSRRNRA